MFLHSKENGHRLWLILVMNVATRTSSAMDTRNWDSPGRIELSEMFEHSLKIGLELAGLQKFKQVGNLTNPVVVRANKP